LYLYVALVGIYETTEIVPCGAVAGGIPAPVAINRGLLSLGSTSNEPWGAPGGIPPPWAIKRRLPSPSSTSNRPIQNTVLASVTFIVYLLFNIVWFWFGDEKNLSAPFY
jgi:hypothetical protein